MTNTSKHDIFALSKDLGIDMEDMLEIFNVYFIEVNEFVLNLRDLFEKNDWIMIRKVIHNIKGISGNLRINEIYELASKLDNLVKLGANDVIDSCITELEEMIKHTKSEIIEFFTQNQLKI